MKASLIGSMSMAVAFAACVDAPETSEKSSNVDVSNALTENSLSTNGIWDNGIWDNGIWDNGIWDNGIWDNGIWDNGIWDNGIWDNGIWDNGIWDNGIWDNGIWDNGIWDNGLGAERLRTNKYAGQLLQYVYSCAFPPNTYDTRIGPPDAEVALAGSIGVGINADNTTWWETGRCDESCQRWVSACVLARTNAYGVKVRISMRAPDTAPQKIKDALALSSQQEASDYPLREGAFYGNLFQGTPLTQAEPGYSGPALGPVVSTPSFYACAGPGSNVPDLTRRFCSSQGDNSVIRVDGTCTATAHAGSTAICESIGENGALRNCRAGTKTYSEVITVYVKDLIEVCGNSVCEQDEALDLSCPSDCHPGGWVKTYDVDINAGVSPEIRSISRKFAEPANDGSVIVGGASSGTVNFGSGPTPAPTYLSNFVVARVRPNQTTAWTKQFTGLPMEPFPNFPGSVGTLYPTALDVGDDDTIALYGVTFSPAPSPSGQFPQQLWVTKLDLDGNVLPGWPVQIGPTDVGATFSAQHGSVAILADGGVAVSGMLYGTVDLGGGHVLSGNGGVVIKLDANGVYQWGTPIHYPTSGFSMSTLAAGSDGNVYYANNESFEHYGHKIDGATGAVIWRTEDFTSNTDVRGIFAADDGSVYVTGSRYLYLINSFAFFLTKYSVDGVKEWETNQLAYYPTGFGPDRIWGGSQGTHLSMDADGNVVVSGNFGVGKIDFGTGWLDAYATNDAFIAGFKTGALAPGERRMAWIKQLPGVLYSTYFNAQVDAENHIIAAGAFSGSLNVDDRVIITPVPEYPGLINTFVASFGKPPSDDTTPPVIRTEHVPHTITIEATIKATATTPAGANVWYVQPTATDAQYSGVNVSCEPPPNAFFPIGTTTVTCTATDPAGNTDVETFNVSVGDTTGPTFVGVPRALHVAATSGAGAIIEYDASAIDRLDGNVDVDCDPPSGSMFPPGETTVTCTATDSAGHESVRTFGVLVDAMGDITPPTLVVPQPIMRTTSGTGGIVVFDTSAFDGVDGKVPVTCDHASGATFPLGVTTVTCSAHDSLNNVATRSFTITVDPEILPPSAPVTLISQVIVTNGAFVEYAPNVAGTTCLPLSGMFFAEGTTQVTCTAVGGSTSTFALTIADHTAPAIVVPPPITLTATGPSGAVVTYDTSATDFVDGDVEPDCEPDSGSTLPIGTWTVACTARDALGHTATASFSVTVKSPTPPPVLSLPATMNVIATSATGANVTYAATATAGAEVECSIASGGAFPLGTTTVTCSATNAGGTTTGSFLVNVAFAWSGFLQPINADGSSIFKINSNVPVKFQLTGASAPITTAVAHLSLVKLGSAVSGTEIEVVATGTADTGNLFRYASGQYQFNMSTKNLSAGTYALRIDLHDGVTREVEISLKK